VTAELERGGILRVMLPPSARGTDEQTSYGLSPDTTHVLTPVAGAAGSYTGTADGTAQIVVTQTPKCATGSACPAHVLLIGRVTVRVSG
jgi:hypothetical protein